MPTISDHDCIIDEHILQHIQPVLRFINHAAVLKSTKDNILIFEYKSSLRHIIGARDSMLVIAKQCFPEIKVCVCIYVLV